MDEFKEVLKEIERVSPHFFRLALKECYICENTRGEEMCIKFDLYSPLNRDLATSFGFFLKKYVSKYGVVYKLKKVNNVFYAVVYSEPEEDLKVEFIDEMFIDNISELKNKAKEYFMFDENKANLPEKELENDSSNKLPKIDTSLYREELKKANGIFKERGENLPYNMKENLFVSLLNNINDNFDMSIFENIDKVDSEDSYMKLYRVEGQIRSIKNFNLDEDNRIYLKNEHDESMLRFFEVTDKNYEDYGYKEYIDISNLNEEKLEKYKLNIEDVYVNYELCGEFEISQISNLLKFNVYNAGQALCTSLSVKDCVPFLYFDFGNKLSDQTNLEYNEETAVVISHNHDDHWNELKTCLKNDVHLKGIYIMDNCQEIDMNQILGMLCLNGVKTYRIHKEINVSNVVYFIPVYASKMKYKKVVNNKITRINNNVNSGIMFIDRGTKKILVPGDQLYENIDPKYIENLDVLVATHHGGYYGFPKKNIPKPNNKKSVVVYSYGDNNKYGHPSKVKDYEDKNWNNYFRTAEKKGDFNIDM